MLIQEKTKKAYRNYKIGIAVYQTVNNKPKNQEKIGNEILLKRINSLWELFSKDPSTFLKSLDLLRINGIVSYTISISI